MSGASVKDSGYRSYPLLSRIEWRLSKSRYFAYGMDHVVSKARFQWHEWRRHKRLIPESLMNFESRIFSQNGEDGILLEIFRRIGEGKKFFVEFGIGDGTECCTRNLISSCGWDGLLMEGSQSSADKAASLFKNHPKVSVKQSFITIDNIIDSFRERKVPDDLDLLVVDIDGNDYWILQQILSLYHPRVIICEYNARWTTGTDWVMPYDPSHVWDGGAYFGASLKALWRLGKKHGYKLVCCESRGVNSFFVRADLVGDKFPDQNLELGHYVPPHYGRGFGHQLRFRYRQSNAGIAAEPAVLD
ncbi:MAG TPA: FkbM family methyltransferase [Blastocatellia bacterium]|nr:FkbM family methyltransferase [Blastocatellia bacterium]